MKSGSHARGHEHHQHSGEAPTPSPQRASAATHVHHPAAGDEEQGAHDRHAGHSVEMFRDRFWITLALAIPTLMWSEMIQGWLRFAAPSSPGSAYVPAVFWNRGVPLWRVGVLRRRGSRAARPPSRDDDLISLAISVAFFFSLAVTLG